MDVTLSIPDPKLDKSVEVHPKGWREVTILYSTEIHGGVSYLCWKVKDTEHVFRIHSTVIYEKHGLNYSDHFLVTLEVFREDFLEWKNQGFPEDWMKRYHRIFHTLIL
jgi:hypothetical protein